MKKNIIQTTTDGWDCVEQLEGIVNAIEDLGPTIYEIKYCVRKTPLDEIIQQLSDASENLLRELRELKLAYPMETEFVTIDEDED
jgi:hypothetical protein